jgi:sulfur carrier protein ThiS
MSPEIYLRFYEELNDFLPPSGRKRRFAYELSAGLTVRKLLSELGVPPGRVELVLINGNSAAFSDILELGDFVSVFPVFESFDIGELVRMRGRPLRRTRFLAGPRLMRLAGYLRLLGFDTVDCQSWPIEKIVRVSETERRIVLTRDPALMKSPDFSRIYLVRKLTPKMQLVEVLSRFDLYNSTRASRLHSIIDDIPIPETENQ